MLNPNSPLTAYTTRQVARLKQFMLIISCLVLGLTPVYVVVGMMLHEPLILLINIWNIAGGLLALFSYRFTRRSQPAQGAFIFGLGMIIIAVTLTLLLHPIWPSLIFIALVGSRFALPYLDRTRATRTIAACALGIGLIMLGAHLPLIQAALPRIAPATIPIISICVVSAAASMLLLILWQSSTQTRELLKAMETANVSLHVSQAAEATARQNEQALREAEAKSRAQLEDTVATYLAFAEQIARGDLTQELDVVDDGVLGRLGHGLNRMRSDLHTLTEHMLSAATNIAAASVEILAATTQQAASAAEQSAAISQTSATVEEIKTITQQTAQQANQVAHDSQSVIDVAQQGTRAIQETVSSMRYIRAQVESIAHTILALAEQTEAIALINTTVSELAEQSNLLALNAAIEAARAGEHGRSFGVVAQHVRDLAERSKSATLQVRSILSDIQRATSTAVLVTEEGTKGVDSGGRLSEQAGHVIFQIATEVETSAQANVQIAAAAQQQTAGMEQIGQAISAIQQATMQALASTRQAEHAAHGLHTLARSLESAIASYRL